MSSYLIFEPTLLPDHVDRQDLYHVPANKRSWPSGGSMLCQHRISVYGGPILRTVIGSTSLVCRDAPPCVACNHKLQRKICLQHVQHFFYFVKWLIVLKWKAKTSMSDSERVISTYHFPISVYASISMFFAYSPTSYLRSIPQHDYD